MICQVLWLLKVSGQYHRTIPWLQLYAELVKFQTTRTQWLLNSPRRDTMKFTGLQFDHLATFLEGFLYGTTSVVLSPVVKAVQHHFPGYPAICCDTMH